ncbi:MAG: LCP family protein [Actinomycetota bacterium]|nr:LCP family protein [Actinomycetota bacterium]
METREAKLLRRKVKTRRVFLTAAALTLIAGVVFGLWISSSSSGGAGLVSRIAPGILSEPKVSGDPVNIVLIGSDSRRGEAARSDTLIFMRVDFNRNRVYLMSIPRDTRVDIPGRGKDKINAAYAYGQASLAIRTVESFLGVDINHYVEVDFQGFKKLVDTLGGIDITVPKGINDRTFAYRMFIPKGPQHMNGTTALNYVRYRHGDSDFDRADRQQTFLRALAANTLNVKAIFKLPTIIRIFDENIGTDMSKRQMLSLGGFLRQLPKDRIETITLPGRPTIIGGISYVEPDRGALSAILGAIEAGRSIKGMKSQIESGKISMTGNSSSVVVLNGAGSRAERR